MKRRRRRRNPARDHVTVRELAGVAFGLLVPALVEAERSTCADGLPAGLGCGDVISAAILAGAPIVLGLGSQGGALEAGTFRSGVAIGGVMWAGLLALDALSGRRRLARAFASLHEEPLPKDIVVTKTIVGTEGATE